MSTLAPAKRTPACQLRGQAEQTLRPMGPQTLPFLSCAGATIREHAEALDRAICALPPPASHVGFLEDATLQCGRLPGKVA